MESNRKSFLRSLAALCGPPHSPHDSRPAGAKTAYPETGLRAAMALERDERDALRLTGILALVVLGFLTLSWATAYVIW